MSGNASSCPNQSPINLSQATSQPCDLLCQLVFDDVYPTSAKVTIESNQYDSYAIIGNTAGLGSCKFNNDGYTARMVLINHRSNHTIESIQGDAEVTIIFDNPTKGDLLVCFVVQSNPNPSNSAQFFNSIVKYLSKQTTEVPLGNNWTLANLIPPSGEYFVYDGTTPGSCQAAKVIVFRSMINIDPNDYATLASKLPAYSQPIQGAGNRNVYFNASKQLPGGPTAMDNRAYLVFRENPSKAGNSKTVKTAGVSDATSTQQTKNSVGNAVSDWVFGQVQSNGVIAIVDIILLILSFGVAFYFGYMKYQMFSEIMYIQRKTGEFGSYLRTFILKPKPVISTASV